MRRFRFSLETVLEVRKRREEACRLELARAQAARDRVLMELAALEHEAGDLLERQGESRARRVDLADETWFRNRHASLLQGASKARVALEEREKELSARREETVKASRDRLVLERLEERQRREHAMEVAREEQGFLDDVAQRAVSDLAYTA